MWNTVHHDNSNLCYNKVANNLCINLCNGNRACYRKRNKKKDTRPYGTLDVDVADSFTKSSKKHKPEAIELKQATADDKIYMSKHLEINKT